MHVLLNSEAAESAYLVSTGSALRAERSPACASVKEAVVAVIESKIASLFQQDEGLVRLGAF